MIELTEPVKLLIAFVIGAVIGLEREERDETLADTMRKRYAPLGVRTFSLMATLGAISGLLLIKFTAFALLLTGIVGSIILIYYCFHSYMTRDIGMTTEIALLYAYIIGVLISIELVPIQVTLAISVIVLLMLSRKEQIKKLVANINQHEINAFTSFALIALVVLPFLPNQGYTLSQIPNLLQLLSNFSINLGKLESIEIINPFKLWTIVALITGVDLFGYILEKNVGKKKGWLFASMAGGFISSTATTLSLAQESRGKKGVNHLVSAAIFANMASFFQIGLIIAALSAGFFVKSIPVLLLLILSCFATAFYFLKFAKTKQSTKEKEEKQSKKEIINLFPALQFALVYLIIQFISKISLEFFGQTGFLVATGIGALSGLDAVIVNTAQLAGNRVEYTLAAEALILANAINLISKTVYSYFQGSSEFTIKFGVSMGIVIGTSLLGLLFI